MSYTVAILVANVWPYTTGAFSVVVRDPLYLAQPLYDYDVGAACPVDFSVTFVVPTDSYDHYDKTLFVHIVDSYRTIKVTVFRPAPNQMQQTFGAFKKRRDLSAEGSSRLQSVYEYASNDRLQINILVGRKTSILRLVATCENSLHVGALINYAHLSLSSVFQFAEPTVV